MEPRRVVMIIEVLTGLPLDQLRKRVADLLVKHQVKAKVVRQNVIRPRIPLTRGYVVRKKR